MLDDVVVRRYVVVVLVATACTRGNPAFGEGTDGGTAQSEGEGSATRSTSDPSDPSVASMTGNVESGETSATSPVDTGDDAIDPTETTDPETDSGNPGTTGGTMTCEVGKPPSFEIYMFDANANPVDPACGGTTQILGPVTPGEAPNQLVIRSCINDTCECADGDELTLVFENLSPSPVDAIDNGDNACVSLAWSRAADDDGCRVTWLLVETQVVNADHPRFMASNVATPDWSLVMPPAAIGPSIERCEEDTCSTAPGLYTMMLGDHGPIAPGEAPVPAMFNPYTNGDAPYDVYAQFAQVQDDCSVNVGWAAIEID